MALTPFATVEELELGWRDLDERERATAATLILRATAQLSSLLAAHGIAIDPEDERQASNLATVTCNMVRRSMGPSAADGISQMSQTIGSTTASVTWGNPDGAFFLSRMDKLSLGLLSGGGARSIMPRTAADREGV